MELHSVRLLRLHARTLLGQVLRRARHLGKRERVPTLGAAANLVMRIGLKGKFNRVLQLHDNHTVKLFFSHEEKLQHSPKPTQPKPNPISGRSRQPDRCVE